MTTRERYRGALLGTAAGDALGAPFEGHAPSTREAVQRLRESPGAMRYTDDTAQAIALAESLAASGGVDGGHLAAAFLEAYRREPWRGYGGGTIRWLGMLADGVPWEQAAGRVFGGSGSMGNGAAMRVAPVAVFAGGDLEATARLACEQARVTHAHSLGIEGAVVQGCAVALALRSPDGTPLDAAAFLDALGRQAQSEDFRAALAEVRALLASRPLAPAEVARRLGHNATAPGSVPAAVYCFLRTPDSFADAVLEAVALGGDADTIAAMAGAMAGARGGEEAIPVRWRETLEDAERIMVLADRLTPAGGRPSTPGA